MTQRKMTVFDSLKQRLVPRALSLVPLDLWHRLLGVELVVPFWHTVSDLDLPHVSGLLKFRTLAQFKSDLDFFLRHYTPVSLQDVISHLDGAAGLPQRSFLPTFDDGFREIYDIAAPILHSRGVPAVFFLNVSTIDNRELGYLQKKSLLIRSLASGAGSAVEREVTRRLDNSGIKGPDLLSRIQSIDYRQKHVLSELGPIMGCDFCEYVTSVKPYLTSDQVVVLMKMGFAIGAHSFDHPDYSELSLEEQLSQTLGSMDRLSSLYRFECRTFAFPHTDEGISDRFFEEAFSNESLKVSFGTGGLLWRFFPRNLSRFTMERTDLPAAQILARRFGKAFLHVP
jgi:peptidoglycan/xylan/chitin deacetylase (PgdA/CDA1 family)